MLVCAAAVAMIFGTETSFGDDATLRERLVRIEKQLAQQPDQLDLLYEKCDLLDQLGRVKEALTVAEEIRKRDDSYGAHIRLGWLNLKSKNFKEAEEHYRIAAQKTPQSIDPWLGLQNVALERKDWKKAEEAGVAAIALDPKNFWAISRKAYAEYMNQEYSAAKTDYLKALEISRADPEMLLGLGFARIKLGEIDEGRKLCEQARTSLVADKRVDECLAMSRQKKLTATTTASATYLRYLNPWNIRDLRSLYITGALTWPAGITSWIGVTFSYAKLRYEVDDFRQLAPVIGIDYNAGGWSAGSSADWLFSNNDEVNSTVVATLHMGYDWKRAGIHISAAGSFYPSFSVYQIDPLGVFRIGDRFELGIGPELMIVGAYPIGGPNPETADQEMLGSGKLDFRWRAYGPLTIFGSGFAGRRRYAVDFQGLSVWSNNDLFAGGYDLGFNVDACRHIGVYLDFRHYFGIEQEAMKHDFNLLGGAFGLRATF